MSTNEPPPPPTEPPAPPPPASPGGYSVGNTFSYGWSKFTQHLGQILLAIVVLVAVLIAIQLVGFLIGRAVACDPGVTVTDDGFTADDCGGLFAAQNIVSWLFSLIGWIVGMIIGAGIVRGALDITEGRELEPSTLLTPHRLGEVVIASLVTGILTFVGFVLLVIPGLLVLFFTSYTLYFLMDRPELGAIDAIKASFDFTRSNAGNVILWFLVSLAAWFVGALLCGVGLVVAVPVVVIGTAYTYKTLNGEPVAP
jgi:uncharacterized membrane protein